MPIWEKIELFCRAILDEGRKEAEKILSEAKAEAVRTVAVARERAAKELQKEILAQKSRTYVEAGRRVDAAELEARKRIIAFREQVIREIFRALELRLKQWSDTPDYPDFLLSAVKEGITALPGKEFVVELKPDDLALVKENAARLEKDRVLKIELRPSPAIEGGARIYTGDRRMLYDNGLPARLKRREDEIRREIWSKIFETARDEGPKGRNQ